MAFKRIIKFEAGIPSTGKGEIFFELEDGTKDKSTGLEATTFTAIMTVLSRSNPMYDSITKMFGIEEIRAAPGTHLLTLNQPVNGKEDANKEHKTSKKK